MKFDVVIGNSPYQSGNSQVYACFYTQAIKIGSIVSLIFPQGWQEPKNENLLNLMNNGNIKRDKQIKEIINVEKVFADVPGAEKVNIVIWKKGHDNKLNGKQKIIIDGKKNIVELLIEKTDIQKPDVINSLKKKVDKIAKNFINSIGSARKPYGFEADPIDNPKKYGITILKEKNKDTARLFGRKKGIGRIYIYTSCRKNLYVLKNINYSFLKPGATWMKNKAS